MKDIHFIGDSQETLRGLALEVRKEVGFALYVAQNGEKALNAFPMVGFGSSKVIEIIANERGGTYRAIYTVRFAEAVYVLHVFQKKSKRGRKTPAEDKNLIEQRLKGATRHYRAHYVREQERKNEPRSGGDRG